MPSPPPPNVVARFGKTMMQYKKSGERAPPDEVFTLSSSAFQQGRVPISFTNTPLPEQTSTSHNYCDIPRLNFTSSSPIPFASQFEEIERYLPRPGPMERRRGALPIGNNDPNSIDNMPDYLQNSFGSTNSTGSTNSFRTQVPLPYHLPQHYQGNNQAVGMGYAQTGSNGSLNPTSSPYIPQGDTPVLPSLGFNAQGWGVLATANGGMASAYQQQPGQNFGGMQYQGGNPYQQGEMMGVGGPVGNMGSQLQNFNNGPGLYGHFGTHGNPSNTPYSSNGQMMSGTPCGAPDMGYDTAGKSQSLAMPYIDGVNNKHANQMHNNGSENNMHLHNNGFENNMHQQPTGGSFGFNPNQGTMYGAQFPGTSSFNSNPVNMYSSQQNTVASSFTSMHSGKYGNQNQNHGGKSKSGSQNQKQKQSRPESRNSSSSGNRFQKKSFAPEGKERKNIYRGNANQRSTNSSTPLVAGPVQAPKGAHMMSPETEISKIVAPESSRIHKGNGKAVEDTSNVLTPVKLLASAAEVASEQGRKDTKTPQLRSRRGQTIPSATEPMRKQSVTEWAVSVHNSSEKGTIHQELKNRGSPVIHAMSLMTLKESDPFTSSLATSKPFDCITVGPFARGFRIDALSRELQALTQGGTRNPPIAEALDPYNIPFVEYSRLAKPDNYGVIKIKNIPYGTNRAEVLAFLGRNAKIVNESEYEPVHIIMERVTSKTLDCFVEFVDLGEAVSAVNRFENNRATGRGRLGQRHVEVELSTQGALMKELFPKAKNVQWDGGRPRIIPRNPEDPYNSGFQSFIIKEELIMLLKHVESPQRTPFSKDCPQRSFECLISTLVKYPWYMVDYITIEDRNLLHETTKRMLEILVDRVNNDEDSVNLTHMLLKRVWRAALQCDGFSPSMKDDIVCIAGLDDRTAIQFGMAPHASYWNKLWTLGPKPDAPVDVILWYAAKIRQACVSTQQLSLAEQAELGIKPKEYKLFGDLDDYIKYGKGLGQMTLAHVAKIEWTAIENALRQAFA